MQEEKKCEIIIFHFGVHKTGSSSIQETLFANQHCLGGIKYIHFGKPNSSLVIRNCFHTTKRLLQKRRVACSREKAQQIKERANKKLNNVLTAVVSNRLLISAEETAHFNAEECQDMVTALKCFTDNLLFIGYVREPVSYARSVFQQQIKLVFKPFSNAISKFMFHQFVNQLDNLVGRENVHVFAFDRDLFPGGDVVHHFLSEVGIEPNTVKIQKKNESLSLLAVKLLYTYRKLKVRNEREMNDIKSWPDFINGLASLKDAPFIFHPEIENKIMAANRDIIDWSEDRLNTPLKVTVRSDDAGIRREDDLLSFSDEDLARLTDYVRPLGIMKVPARATPGQVASVVHDIRLSYISRAYSLGKEIVTKEKR